MKKLPAPPILGQLAVAALLAALSGCSTLPTTERLPENRDSCDCDLQNDSLGQLLEYALDEPESSHATHSLAHFVERWHAQPGATTGGMVSIGDRRYEVKFGNGHSRYSLDYFDVISPAIDYEIKRLDHHRMDGVGAPLVALRENTGRAPIEDFYPPEAITRPLTAVITRGELASGPGVQTVQVDLLCPLMQNTAVVNGQARPLAVDLSVPWAKLLERARELKRTKLQDFSKREKRLGPQLYLMEPYDPNKEPLIMIHGLLSTPLVWAEISNTLWADDAIRSRYQIWHFLYDTSAPALYSSRILREKLREVRPMLDPEGDDPAMQSTTIIAHSMGGIVTRGLLTRPGDAFWDAAFTRPFDSLELSEADRGALQEAFFWDSAPHIKRVIYIAASHRGSDVADNVVGRLGRLLAKPDRQFQEFYARISGANPGAFTEDYARLGEGKLDSIHALSPKQPTLKILAELPNHHQVREFSIIGDRGRPGPLDRSSDGTVEYWSSHIDRAESEKVIPADHFGVLEHESSLAEVKRILKLP